LIDWEQQVVVSQQVVVIDADGLVKD